MKNIRRPWKNFCAVSEDFKSIYWRNPRERTILNTPRKHFVMVSEIPLKNFLVKFETNRNTKGFCSIFRKNATNYSPLSEKCCKYYFFGFRIVWRIKMPKKVFKIFLKIPNFITSHNNLIMWSLYVKKKLAWRICYPKIFLSKGSLVKTYAFWPCQLHAAMGKINLLVKAFRNFLKI